MIFTPPGERPALDPVYLQPAHFIDSDAPSIRTFAARTTAGRETARDCAVALFYAVRDGWRYDPFDIRLDPAEYVASRVLAAENAWCVQKGVLLAAAARAVGIPAAFGLSDVVNHLTTEKLRARMGGSTFFVDHGYAVLFLDGKWVKAAPAFNIELCRRFGVVPTEFDGTEDAVFQEFDASNRRHMEYVRDHGMWSDFPYDKVEADFREHYPPSLWGESDDGERFEDGTILR
jgi:transglutaminase-like putative cysteine protease